MNGWTLSRFNTFREELRERGLLEQFWPALRAHFSPAGELSLFEVIDGTTPEQWREVLTLLVAGDGAQAAPLLEAAHE